MSSEKEGFDRRGVTHCHPHDNRMPCAECGTRLKKIAGETCELCGSEITGHLCECSIPATDDKVDR